jgi:hypothetical protein
MALLILWIAGELQTAGSQFKVDLEMDLRALRMVAGTGLMAPVALVVMEHLAQGLDVGYKNHKRILDQWRDDWSFELMRKC